MLTSPLRGMATVRARLFTARGRGGRVVHRVLTLEEPRPRLYCVRLIARG